MTKSVGCPSSERVSIVTVTLESGWVVRAPEKSPPGSPAAEANGASVRVGRENGIVEIEVRDDGVGGADLDAGTGLRGLEDRVAALEGSFAVRSGRGEGTIVEARIPCE